MFLKGRGNRGGSGKDAKVQSKLDNLHSTSSDPGLPIRELIELKNILATMKQSFLQFLKTVFDALCRIQMFSVK